MKMISFNQRKNNLMQETAYWSEVKRYLKPWKVRVVKYPTGAVIVETAKCVKSMSNMR